MLPLLRPGSFYFVEFWLGFHVGFIGVCDGQRKLIMDGKAIARYYVLKGRCPIDLLTAVAWVVQVRDSVASSRPIMGKSPCTRLASRRRPGCTSPQRARPISAAAGFRPGCSRLLACCS